MYVNILNLFCRNATYTDNREIEGRIFHLAKEFQVPLFEKDPEVEKRIESLYRVSKVSCFLIRPFSTLPFTRVVPERKTVLRKQCLSFSAQISVSCYKF